MPVTDENRPWNQNRGTSNDEVVPTSKSAGSVVNRRGDKAPTPWKNADDDDKRTSERIEFIMSPAGKVSRKHRNSNFLHRLRLGKSQNADKAVMFHDEESLLGSNDTSNNAMRRDPIDHDDDDDDDNDDHDSSSQRKEGEKKKKDIQSPQGNRRAAHSSSISSKSGSSINSSSLQVPSRGIKRFMKKKRQPLTSSSSSSQSNHFSSAEEEKKTLQSENLTKVHETRIHFDDSYSSSCSMGVKKRKSDEGLPSATTVHNGDAAMEEPCSVLGEGTSPTNKKNVTMNGECSFEKQPKETHPSQSIPQVHGGKDPKRLRESFSPIQNQTKTTAGLVLPPVENLALNCSKPSKFSNKAEPLMSVDSREDIMNSSLSSNSPMSMEPGAFSSLYQNDSDDDIPDGHPITCAARGIDFCDTGEEDIMLDSSVRQTGARLSFCSDEEVNDFDSDEPDDESESDPSGNDNESGEDDSDASTVVNSLPPARVQKPPPGATKEEQDRFYWELCYGKGSDRKMEGAYMKPPMSFSAVAKVPKKSCLSAKKTPWTEIANSASKRIALRKEMMALSSGTEGDNDWTPGNDKHKRGEHYRNPSYSTPQGNNNNNSSSSSSSYIKMKISDGKKSVKFGALSAAEFESTRPTVELTPLPAEQVKEEFGMDKKDEDSDDDSVEMHQETARNADKLAMWEDDFDSYCDDWDKNDSIISMDDDSDEEKLEPFVPRKNQSRGSDRYGRSSSSANRDRRGSSSDRRSSIFFSKSGGSLLNPEDMASSSLPKENPSVDPSWNEENTVEVSNKRASSTSRDSLQFSSPSTSSGSFIRLSNSGSESSKVTPNTDLSSSSNLLRSVHSEGGASLGDMAASRNRQDDVCTELKPSQLDYALKCVNSNNSLKDVSPYDLDDHLTCNYTPKEPASSMCSRLLQRIKINCFHDHELRSLIAMEQALSHDCVSFLDIVQDLDVLCYQSNLSYSEFDRYEIVGVLEMAVTLLEEFNNCNDEFDDGKLCKIIEAMSISLQTEEIANIYSVLMEKAVLNWLEQEMEVMQTAREWLQPILKFNRVEEERIDQLLDIVVKHKITGNDYLMRRKVHREDEEACGGMLQILENKLREELDKLEVLKQEACILAWKCEVEESKSEDLEQYALLTSLLPYQCTLDKPSLSVCNIHLDGTQTVIYWEPSEGVAKRDSMSTVESVERTTATILTTPRTKRLEASDDLVSLPQNSEAWKLYRRILDGGELQNYLIQQFQIEHEMAILTVSDTFQRMNLMALDILEVEKSPCCNIETSFNGCLATVHISIQIKKSIVVHLRCIYDLSIHNTFFNMLPTDLSIDSVEGIPYNSKEFSRDLRMVINQNLRTNVLLLGRISGTIIETFGRDDNENTIE